MAYLDPTALIAGIAGGAELIDGTVTVGDNTYSMGPRVYAMLSPPCYASEISIGDPPAPIIVANTVRGQFKADLDGDVVTLVDPS